MTEDLLVPFRERYEALSVELERAAGEGEGRERIRDDITRLFRDTEEAIEQLSGFREEIRTLVQRYKALPRSVPPATAGSRRADLLGSSTFTEKGWHAIAAGDAERAIEALNRALELAPGDTRAEGLLGWALMLDGRHDEALLCLQRLLAKHPDDALARANLGYICLKKGIFGEAIEHLSRVLRLDNDPKAKLYANHYLGLVYLEREMYTDARAFFARALELGPNLVEARWESGRAAYLAGDADGARESWSRGAESARFSPWGERCRRALERLDAGEDPRIDQAAAPLSA